MVLGMADVPKPKICRVYGSVWRQIWQHPPQWRRKSSVYMHTVAGVCRFLRGCIGCGQTWEERVEIGASIFMTSGGNTAKMVVFLATSATPTPPGPRHIPVSSMDAPGYLVERVGGQQRDDREGIERCRIPWCNFLAVCFHKI